MLPFFVSLRAFSWLRNGLKITWMIRKWPRPESNYTAVESGSRHSTLDPSATNIISMIRAGVSNPRQVRTIPGWNFAHLDKCREKRAVRLLPRKARHAATAIDLFLSFGLQ